MSRKLLINCFFVFAGLFIGLVASAHSWQVWLQQRQRTNEQISRMHSVEQTQEDLLRKESRAKTNLGKEEMARANGWVKASETPAG